MYNQEVISHIISIVLKRKNRNGFVLKIGELIIVNSLDIMISVKKLTNDLVQAIIVLPSAYQSLEDMLSDVAIASIFSSYNDPNFDQWYQSGQLKTVRRVKTVTKLENIYDIYHRMYYNVSVPPLMRYDQFAKPVLKAQVSGWKEYSQIYGDNHDKPSFGTFLVNNTLDMSPGKIAAQVSHAITMYYVRTGKMPIVGDTISLKLANEKEILKCKDVVVDAGHTEIPSGSITCGFVPKKKDDR